MTRLWAIVAWCVASAAAVAAAYDCADICPSPENSYRVDLSKAVSYTHLTLPTIYSV